MCYPWIYQAHKKLFWKSLSKIYFDQKHPITSFNKKNPVNKTFLFLKWMAKRIIIVKYFVEEKCFDLFTVIMRLKYQQGVWRSWISSSSNIKIQGKVFLSVMKLQMKEYTYPRVRTPFYLFFNNSLGLSLLFLDRD